MHAGGAMLSLLEAGQINYFIVTRGGLSVLLFQLVPHPPCHCDGGRLCASSSSVNDSFIVQ